MSSRQPYWPASVHDASWPPTVMRLHPYRAADGDVEIDELNLSDIDDDPLTYFLSPASADHDADGVMDFDAGIEGASKRPGPVVRSVSPSSLSPGLRLSHSPNRVSAEPPAAPRPPTPPRAPPTPDLEFDMPATPDDDEYGYFARAHGLLPLALRDVVWRAKRKVGSRNDTYYDHIAADQDFPSPPCFPRGVAPHRPKPVRLSPHSWREPSPDVWAIEEETEELVGADGGLDAKTQPINIPDAKPKKRVRFVLPGEEQERPR